MDERDERSSSLSSLSSATSSDAENTPGPLTNLTANLNPLAAGNPGVANNSHPLRQSQPSNSSAGAPATSAGSRQEDGAVLPAVKRPRKKRDPNAPAKPEKKPRATTGTRRARGASTAATGSRKKLKVEPAYDGNTIHIPRLESSGLESSTLIQPVSFSSQATVEPYRDEAAKHTQSGVSMHDPPMRSQTPSHRPYEYSPNVSVPPPQSNTPRSSAMYDPIRSVTIQRPLNTNPPPSATLQPARTPPKPTYNPSLSPAISGIIDHPAQPSYTTSTTLVTHHPKTEPLHTHIDGLATHSPKTNGNSTPMEVDSSVLDQAHPKKPTTKKVPSEAPTRTTSPKPTRAKEQPPPPPMGSGLLSASLFGGDSSSDMAQKDSGKGPNIVLHVDLKDPNNRVINFARMAEEKYGFAALYPRQAAQKERLAKIAAAGAALERSASGSKFGGTSAGDSGDEDLSVDIERDSENDGDVGMSGVNGGQEPANSGTDGPGPKRRRRRKVEEYDQDDPFVDDSELLWEAQAAASKDGFFVYCGPLVPEGEKPAVERYLPLCLTISWRILTF